MTFISKLRHLFTPHTTNNFRAKLLHNSGIFAVIGIVLASNLFIRLIASDPSLHILGFTSSVTIDQIVSATNQERISLGLPPLKYSEKLADAARRKADNMLTENYWAHTAPSGKSPWTWFKAAGYSYVFAGENLAKDFGDTSRMMSAWMASPTHKENIVNPKYKEIGLAVVPGSLQGHDTVLVVQLFGAPSSGSVPAVAATPASPTIPQVAQVAEVKGETVIEEPVRPTSSPLPAQAAKYNSYSLTRAINLATTALFILVLIIDLFLAESQKLSRRVGNNWSHILFINLILLATTIVNAGRIM